MSISVVSPQPRQWSTGQLRVLAAMGVLVLRERVRGAADELAAEDQQGWSAAERQSKLASALARALGVPDAELWATLAESGLTVPAAAELRASSATKRQLWRQMRTWLARRTQ